MNSQLIEDALRLPPHSPGQLALILHMQGSTDLQVTLPKGWDDAAEEVGQGYIVSDGKLTFLSLANRNQVLAKHVFIHHFSSGSVACDVLYSVAHTLWSKEIGHTDLASGRFMVEASKHVDVLNLAAIHIASGAYCFDVLHVIEAMLVHTQEIRIPSLIELVRAQHERVKGDLFAGLIYSALDKWLTTRPEVACEIYQSLAESTDDVDANLIGAAVIGLSRSIPEKAVAFSISESKSEQIFRSRIGYWMCGQLLQQTNIPTSDLRELERVILNGFFDEKIDIKREAVRSAASSIHISVAFDGALRELAQDEDQDVLAAIENTLFLKSSELQQQGRFFNWLPLLVALAPRGARPMDGLDHVLSTVLKNNAEKRFEVINFLTFWTLRHSECTPIEKAFSQCFNQCMYKLAEQPDLLASVVTEWLANDARQLAGAAAGILSELEVHGFQAVNLDSDKLGLMSSDELMFLARRLLGFVHNSHQLLTLSLSMLKVRPDALPRVLPILRSLIVDEIGYDYPGTTIEALTFAAVSETRQDIKLAIETWRQNLESSQDELERLPRLNELRPPSQVQRQFALARSRQMNLAREEASKNSIVRQLATEIPLKAGRGCFNHAQGQFGEPSSLQTFSYSIELPRREVLDPVGNAIRGFHLRTAEKNSK